MMHHFNKKYLFIGAHVDDIELCCGGTIAKLLEQDNEVRCYTFSYLNDMRLLNEHTSSMDKLGVQTYIVNTYKSRTFSFNRQRILDDLFDFKLSYSPDYIFTHDCNDLHQDHAVIGYESKRAFKNYNLITYTAPWNSESNNPNFFVSLNKNHIDKKVDALNEYESQKHRHYFFEDMIYTNATYWSNKSTYAHYCEAFNIISLHNE